MTRNFPLLYFNPRSSCEERPRDIDVVIAKFLFQSTLLMRGATVCFCVTLRRFDISIHAPHARSDPEVSIHTPSPWYFNPRSSCEERPHCSAFLILYQYFNPRSSCEERLRLLGNLCARCHFNPRSSCEERLDEAQLKERAAMISIHAPHARSDARDIDVVIAKFLFQSTLLMRGATLWNRRPSDRTDYFNPRSSCEERHG